MRFQTKGGHGGLGHGQSPHEMYQINTQWSTLALDRQNWKAWAEAVPSSGMMQARSISIS